MVLLFSCLWVLYTITAVGLVLEIVSVFVFSDIAISLFLVIEEQTDSTHLRNISLHLIMLSGSTCNIHANQKLLEASNLAELARLCEALTF
jgi:hypothetical protein